jgi:hypothetical protein
MDTLPAPLTAAEADRLLADAPLRPYAKGSLRDGKALVEQLLARGVPAAVSRPDDCCSGGSCGPKFEVLVREEDLLRIAQLQHRRWQEDLAREGLVPAAAASATATASASAAAPSAPSEEAEGEPPCPACGTVGPLLHGACTDCGLQLE